MSTALLVEDDFRIRHFVRLALEGEGLDVVESSRLDEARQRFADEVPDLLVLDLGLPDGDGVALIRELRPHFDLPILVLSARTRETDKVCALDAGADDYLSKPFGVAELLARVRALLRRGSMRSNLATVVMIGDIAVDLARHTLTRGADIHHLTPIEFRLLNCFLSRPGQVLTQRQLLKEVWGAGHADRGHYLRVYVGRLRHKIEVDPTRPRYLLTETGVGYRLEP